MQQKSWPRAGISYQHRVGRQAARNVPTSSKHLLSSPDKQVSLHGTLTITTEMPFPTQSPRQKHKHPPSATKKWLRTKVDKLSEKLFRMGEYGINHWPWKLICVPLFLVLVGIYWLEDTYRKEGGWIAMFEKRKARKRYQAKLRSWEPQLLVRADDISMSSWLGLVHKLALGPWKLGKKWRGEGEMCIQPQSPFFAKLPVEIRQKIFEAVIEGVGCRLHIQQSYRRFGIVPCSAPGEDVFEHEVMECLWDQVDRTDGESLPTSWSRLVMWDEKMEKLEWKPRAGSRRKTECVMRKDYLLAMALSCKRGYVRHLFLRVLIIP